jgi:hypothetical protein
MHKTFVMLVMVLCFGVTGCATHHQPSTDELLEGKQRTWTYPTDYQQSVKKYMQGHLIDPTAPIYTFLEPKKGYCASPILRQKRITWAWVVDYTVNSKNSFGGYTGGEDRRAAIVDDQVICEEYREKILTDQNHIQVIE